MEMFSAQQGERPLWFFEGGDPPYISNTGDRKARLVWARMTDAVDFAIIGNNSPVKRAES